MLQKLKILDATLDKLEDIDDKSFLFQSFKDVNSEIEKILFEIKNDESNFEKNNLTEDQIKTFKDLLNKIYRLETKFLPKANLLEEFSKSNP